MHLRFRLLFLLVSAFGTASAQQETPQQSLNQYVAFLNQSVEAVTRRFQMLQTYQADVARYREKPDLIRLPSSGPLEEFYYHKALAGNGLTATEKKELTASTQVFWQLLTRIDQAGKSLETYVRLKDYQRDNLEQSDELISSMQAMFRQFRRDKDALYKQIQRIYHRYQPYQASNAYLYTEREMDIAVLSQYQLLDSLPYYLNENSRPNWPVTLVQQSMLTDEQLIARFGKMQASIGYPAFDMVNSFRTALRSVQAVKRSGIDDNTFAAQQSAQHGNNVYLSLLNYVNNDLLASYQAFVDYSRSAKPLLSPVKVSPVFTVASPVTTTQAVAQTRPFIDKPLIAFTTKRAAAPASKATFQALTRYVAFINESLRQMHQLQVLLRNYASSAAYHRDPTQSQQHARLAYSHEEVKLPVSAYQLLMSNSQNIPGAYRPSIHAQAEVLMNMLNEMDGLSIELTTYTAQKQYLQDRFSYSDAILDRYAYLFDAFDQKKEQLYRDVRRIFDSYPTANPASSWNLAGKAMLKTLDDNTDVLFGVKSFLKLEAAQLPTTDKLTANARTLMADEYTNLKGLQRLGRSNGLCPYSPYEDLADNTLRFADITRKVKPLLATLPDRHPYESFYYFYNNELVYEYNKFTELAKDNLLPAVNQPDVFLLRRPEATSTLPIPPRTPTAPTNEPVTAGKPSGNVPAQDAIGKPKANVPERTMIRHDTLVVERTKLIERTRTDTVYIDRGLQREVPNTLAGFAANNMVLLLDVSASMDSPVKLPLLKRSIKSLLTLLRPEDQLSIVVYSGKAKVALKPTSGANTAEITRVIDALQSSGDTDGNGGIQLAYKVADKHYIRGGNNRIILATDGEFPVSDDVFQLISDGARQDIYLTVFTFGRNKLTGQNLTRLSQLGKGTFTHVTPENANLQLIQEAQAKTARGK
ncbi:VWA domain-containing protein [Fibrella sp. HMF5405]|uniref:VWA domain-containing protein n=2 Tax=Fibrella forsythiae TaxID=2817061 RepID=A0ABS3JGL1_9BACT|nr:VWA domain-containing protein [Fibrella forsythiae]